MTTVEIIAYLSLTFTTILGAYTVWSEYKTNRLSATDDIASGARTIIELTRDEWERERAKRIALEAKIALLDEEVKQLKINNSKAITCALLLYGQVLSSGMEPSSNPRDLHKY